MQNRRLSLLVRERHVNDMNLEHQLLRLQSIDLQMDRGQSSKKLPLVYLGMRICHGVCLGRHSATYGATQGKHVWDTAMKMGMHSSLHTVCHTAPIQAELSSKFYPKRSPIT